MYKNITLYLNTLYIYIYIYINKKKILIFKVGRDGASKIHPPLITFLKLTYVG